MNITTSNFFPSSDHISLNCQMSKRPICVLTVQVSRVQLFATAWTVAYQASLSITNSQSLLKHMSIESVMPSHPLSSPSLPAFSPSQHQVFSNKSVLRIRLPKYWSFRFRISQSFHEYSGPISFRMDWLDLLAVQGILKSLLQHYSSKATILRCSAFFIVQLSHPYTTTGKTIASTIVGPWCMD